MSSEMDDIQQEFITESRDMVDDSVPRLIELQQTAESTGDVDDETINSIFRTFHSIKGSAGFLGFKNISEVTHNAENLLDLYRKGTKDIAPAGIDALLKAADFMHAAIDLIESEGSDAALTSEAGELASSLRAVIAGDSQQAPKEPAAVKEEKASKKAAPAKKQKATEKKEPEQAKAEAEPEISFTLEMTDEMRAKFVEESDDVLGRSEEILLELDKDGSSAKELIPEAFRMIHSFKGNCGFMGYADMESVSHTLETVMDGLREGSIERSKENISLFLKVIDVLRGGVADVSGGGSGGLPGAPGFCSLLKDLIPADAAEAAAPPASEPEPEKAEAPEKSVPTEQSKTEVAKREPAKKNIDASPPKTVVRRDIRVDLDKLDNLINLVGELVIAQVMVTKNPDVRDLELENFERASGHLDRIVRDLQDVAMSVRMIPIAGNFRKMIRLVHDLSSKFGKKANLELKGEDTEIDKTVAELIADPLVHIIRNALDHGLEMPEERAAAGKPEEGTVLLEARHEGGEIWILIKDDGHGLSREKLLAKGIEKGLVTGDGSQMTDRQVFNLLFEAGFSTAKEVTDVSGRGVGMDVVRKNIEKLKGSVDITSVFGEGSSFIIKIPLTLAIIEGMMVRVGNAKYTIPMLSVRECFRVTGNELTQLMDDQEVVKLRDELMPVVRLYDLHKVKPDSTNLEDGVLVVVESQRDTIALLVDEVLGQHQTVIKGLSRYMGNVRSVSGCTIMGDGDVSLILDAGGLVAMAETSTVEE